MYRVNCGDVSNSMLRFGFGSPPVAASSSSSAAAAETETAKVSSGNRRIHNKYVKMLRRELEGDSVDTEIIDEELRYLKETEPKT